MRWTSCLALLVCAAPLSGCSTTFTPSGPHLAIVVDGGSVAYARDGHVYPHGFFGGGLRDAVSGVPAAEEAAASYQRDLIGGAVGSGISSACLITSLTVGFSQIDDRTPDPAANAAILGGLVCGLVALGVAIGFTVSAPSHHYDAINLYNDAVDRRLREPKPPPPLVTPPPAAPAEESVTP